MFRISHYIFFTLRGNQIILRLIIILNNISMIKSVLLNRLTDGLIFCETNDNYTDENILNIKQKVKKYHKEVTSYSKQTQIQLKQIQNPNFGIYYKVSGYVVFTVIVQIGYPLKLINSFLEVISAAFFDEAKCLLGTQNLRSRLQTIEASHYFIKFDRTIKQKKKQYDDPNSSKNTQRLKRQLQNIQQIMKQNMGYLDQRHNSLLQTQQKAKKLVDQAKNFHTGTKKLVWHLWIKKNMIWIAIAILIMALYFCLF